MYQDPQPTAAQPRHQELAGKIFSELLEMSVEEQVEVLSSVRQRLSQHYDQTRVKLQEEANQFGERYAFLNESLRQ